MRTYLVSLERRITVEVDADVQYKAVEVALLAHSNGEYNELWDSARAVYVGISDVTPPTNEKGT